MKVHIITGHFYPQLHPRAFRANELAKEFIRRGYEVTVSNCWTIKDFDYKQYQEKEGFKAIENFGFFNTTLDQSNGTVNKTSKVKKCLRFLKNYLLAGSTLINAIKLSNRLDIEPDTDLVISLSTPFTCLLGLAIFNNKHRHSYVSIADSGDPFYYSKQYKRAPWFKIIEKFVYRQYEYLTIPTETAIDLYSPLLDSVKIKIIPQGFKMDNLNLYKGSFEGSIKIAYAGVFYWDIRNPEFLFKYLNETDYDFELHLFMRNRDKMIDEYIEKYPKLKGRIFVKSLPHDELLYELSRMHFLINIENISNTQVPSKLIDYGMSGRPILSCNSINFKKGVIEEFMNGNYENQYRIDVQRYNIRRIADEFYELYNSAEKR